MAAPIWSEAAATWAEQLRELLAKLTANICATVQLAVGLSAPLSVRLTVCLSVSPSVWSIAFPAVQRTSISHFVDHINEP